MKQRDNKSLPLKVQLRKHVLDKAKLRTLRVLDLYAGEGLIWRELQKSFRVESYTPVDKAPRIPGTIKANVTPRFLSGFDLREYNVIDVDTYGEPWLVWTHLFPRINRQTVFFLTHGAIMTPGGGCMISRLARRALGIPMEWDIPRKRELSELAGRKFLTSQNTESEVKEGYTVSLQNVRYYGLICKPKKT